MNFWLNEVSSNFIVLKADPFIPVSKFRFHFKTKIEVIIRNYCDIPTTSTNYKQINNMLSNDNKLKYFSTKYILYHCHSQASPTKSCTSALRIEFYFSESS